MTYSRVLRACCILVVGACHDATGPITIDGTYALRTVDGHRLPATIVFDGHSRIVQAATIVIGDPLGAEGTFIQSAILREGNDVLFPTTQGTFVQSGSGVAFTPAFGDPPMHGSVSPRSLTITDSEHDWTYVR